MTDEPTTPGGDGPDLHPLTPEELAEAGANAPYWRERDMALDHDHCFLCGVALTDENRTDEHVFPKWLQRDYDLWNLELNLLNGTSIRYRSLTIPCCAECNGEWLSRVEEQVAEAFRAGYEAVARLDKTVLCLWMGKVYYGIHFKELALPADRRGPGAGAIVPPEHLSRFSELHHILQAMRQRARFDGTPGSVRVYRAQVPDEMQHRFDYKDTRLAPFIAIRVGETVVIVSLLDWEAMNHIDHPTFQAAERLELHPSQFTEVAAFGAYTAMNLNREFAYMVRHEGGQSVLKPVIVLEPGRDPNEPFFDAFVPADMARVLAAFTGFDYDEVYDSENDAVWTNLRREDGSPAVVTLEQAPVGTLVVSPLWKRREGD